MLYQEKRRTAGQFVNTIFAMEIIEFIYTSHRAETFRNWMSA